MVTSVTTAFNNFLKDTVNLDSEKSKKARSSRDWLIEQIKKFPNQDNKFPNLYNDKHIFFGSFARKTKKRPLDDIDIMICLSADGSSGDFESKNEDIEITVNNYNSPLYNFCKNYTSTLNSIKIINKFISLLNAKRLVWEY